MSLPVPGSDQSFTPDRYRQDGRLSVFFSSERSNEQTTIETHCFLSSSARSIKASTSIEVSALKHLQASKHHQVLKYHH
jgi:hypothetical protein